MLSPQELQNNYLEVMERIADAASAVSRSPQDVTLVAVSKGHSVEEIEALAALGVKDFGENRPELGYEKVIQLKRSPGLVWHMIGQVQSRKAKLICEYFNIFHALDRLKLAVRLNAFAGELGIRMPVLLECNVSGEASKTGLTAHDEAAWPDLYPAVNDILALPNLEVRGLMTMAPYDPDPEAARPVFARLRRLHDHLSEQFPNANWMELSMGMTADFEAAIMEGATMVRIGTAIFGARNE